APRGCFAVYAIGRDPAGGVHVALYRAVGGVECGAPDPVDHERAAREPRLRAVFAPRHVRADGGGDVLRPRDPAAAVAIAPAKSRDGRERRRARTRDGRPDAVDGRGVSEWWLGQPVLPLRADGAADPVILSD